MTKTEHPQTNQEARWAFIDVVDFLFWVGIVWVSSALTVSPVLDRALRIIGVIGIITKGTTLFVTRPELILVEAIEYFFLAVYWGSVFIFYWIDKGIRNIFIPLSFGTFTLITIIVGSLILRKYLGMKSLSVAYQPYIKRYGLDNKFWGLAAACGAGIDVILTLVKYATLDSFPFRDDGSLAYKVGQLLIAIIFPMSLWFVLPVLAAISGIIVGMLIESTFKSRLPSLALGSKKIAIIGGIIGGLIVGLLFTPIPQ